MDIYNFYEAGKITLAMFSDDYNVILIGAIVLALLLFCVLFILQGIGLYTMAKRRNLEKKWLAFIPFANVHYMSKLAGECGFFGHKMKNAGLYAMIAQIVSVLFVGAYIFVECYFYMKHGGPVGENQMGTPYWSDLTGGELALWNFYDASVSIYSIIRLVSELLLLVLLMAIYKKYAPRNYTALTLLTLFIPVARYITILVIRKREPFDYDAYIRARREEYIRRQQQQYGNPYNSPYGNPYGNPYGGSYAGQNGSQPQPPKPEDPFEEFASNGTKSDDKESSDSDGFFG